MWKNEDVSFDPGVVRASLAAQNEGFSEFLSVPLSASDDAARMPGWREWQAYRRLPPEAQDPPGLTAGDFAVVYRDVPHPAGPPRRTPRRLNG